VDPDLVIGASKIMIPPLLPLPASHMRLTGVTRLTFGVSH